MVLRITVFGWCSPGTPLGGGSPRGSVTRSGISSNEWTVYTKKSGTLPAFRTYLSLEINKSIIELSNDQYGISPNVVEINSSISA